LTKKTERYIKRKIRSLVLNREEYARMAQQLKKRPILLIWEEQGNAGKEN